jgi:hypothetical protein
MEGAEVIDDNEWRRRELEAQLRSLVLNGEADTPQAEAIRDRIDDLSELENQDD